MFPGLYIYHLINAAQAGGGIGKGVLEAAHLARPHGPTDGVGVAHSVHNAGLIKKEEGQRLRKGKNAEVGRKEGTSKLFIQWPTR